MSKIRRNATLYLNDILEAIRNIEEYTLNMSRGDFLRDRKTRDAVLRNLEIVGEAAKNVPEDVKTKYPDADWRSAAGMRDKLIHEYFGVSYGIVWETVKDDLPPLKQRIEAILKEVGE